jgi:predicted metal-dependent hydrolase
MVERESPRGLDPITEGIRLFNEEYFFEAHEVLEDVWKQEHGEPRLFLQGLIQISAAYHHYQNGNLIGAATLLQRGADKIRKYPGRYLGIDVETLVARVEGDRETIERMQRAETGEKPIEFPRIERKIE